jgi:hypothetical protein
MNNSIQNNLTIHAFEVGYRITDNGEVVNPQGKIIKSFLNGINSVKYLVFSIRDLSKWKYAKKVRVHKLQAYQKFGEKMFEKEMMVRHLDGNSMNNCWDNIAIGTNSDNMMDRSPECRKNSATLASRKMQDNTRSYEERCNIYEDLKNGVPYSEIMKKHNVSSKGTLSFMKNKSEEYKNYINMPTWSKG